MPEVISHINNFLNSFLTISSMIMAKANHQSVYFILMKDSRAEKKTKAAFKSKTEMTAVLRGSLWTVDEKEFMELSRRNTATLRSAESKDQFLTCELQDITKLTTVQFMLLLALTTCRERDALHSDNRRLLEVTRLYEAWGVSSGVDCPRVEVRDEKLSPDPISGSLVFVGEFPEKSGYWFAVEMDTQFRHSNLSNTDGRYEDKVQFYCAPDSGLLVTANKVYPKDTGNFFNASSKDRSIRGREYYPSSVPGSAVGATGFSSSAVSNTNVLEPGLENVSRAPRPDVEIGDRVVWYDERSNMQLATVKWIGVLKDRANQYTIGVENDKPVGSGTGMHNDEQLFTTPMNHASLIPADGLLKAEVVYGSKDLVPPPPNMSRDVFLPSNLRSSPSSDRTQSQYDNMFHQQMKYPTQPTDLHSQSDSGTFGVATIVDPLQRMQVSASCGQITSSRAETESQADRNASLQSGNLRNKHYRGGSYQFCDVTDVRESGSSKPSPNANTLPRGLEFSGTNPLNRTSDSSTSYTHSLRESAPAPNSRIPVFSEAGGIDRAHTTALAGEGVGRGVSAVPRGGVSENFVPMSLSAFELKTDLDLGSMVEVDIPGYDRVQYGVIHWMGVLKDGGKPYAGVELEEENVACTDGTFKDTRLFACAPRKGFFTPLEKVRRDKRFAESSNFLRRSDSAAFGSMECVEIPGVIKHQYFELKDDLEDFLLRHESTAQRVGPPGRNMGIQGHHNSCYLDATLFSMFAFSSAFDSILHRPKARGDITHYTEVQTALRDAIVNPLRRHMFVRADKVLSLRQWLSQYSSIQGLLDEEKDPDEFLISLLQETMRAEPFIKFSSGQSGFCYQLFVEKDDKIQLPTTQQLLSLSLFQSDIKLSEVPRCLILQMPRFGKDFQMYKRIVPSLTLDVTNMLQHDPQPCCFCGKLAVAECRDCFLEFGKGCDRAYFCKQCIKMSHSQTMRIGHNPRDLNIYPECVNYYDKPNAPEIRSEILELFAVICIKTSHYVTFARCGSSPDAPWVFFDSMADRIGQQHGHNVPQLELCPELPNFLKEENRIEIMKCADDKNLPDRMRRLLCDGYICMYQSSTLEPYR